MSRLICFLSVSMFGVSVMSAVGDACKTEAQCGNQEQCIVEYAKGYCVRFDCSAQNPCDLGDRCVEVRAEEQPDLVEMNLCLKTCRQDNDCRIGYRCYEEGVCLP